MNQEDLDVTNEYILLTKEQVKKILGFKSNGALYNAINEHGFPKPLRVGGQASRWRKSDVLKYIDECEQKLAHEVKSFHSVENFKGDK